MPKGVVNQPTRQEYIQRRSAFIARLRGYPYGIGENLRARAIQQMNRQEKQAAHTISSITSTWTPIGPAPIPVGQTTIDPGAVTGRATAFAVHPANPDIAYLGTAQGGLFRTLDGGTTWTALFDNMATLSIGAITLDPADASTVFVGTGEGNLSLDSFFGLGMYIIKHADTSPQILGPFNLDLSGNDIFSYRSIVNIIVSPTDDNIVFCATSSGVGGFDGSVHPERPNRGLFRSVNAMSADPRFSKLDLGAGSNTIVTSLLSDPADPGVLLASVYGQSAFGSIGGIYRTTNALASTPVFTQVQAFGEGINVKFAGTRVESHFVVYAATGVDGALYKSSDGGVTWGNLPAADGFCHPQCWYDIAVAVDPVDTNKVYIGGSWLYYTDQSSEFKRSTDGGRTFANADHGLHADVHAITVASSPNDNVMYFASDGGAWKSTDYGQTWINLNNTGLNTIQFESIAVHPTDENYTLGGTQDNGTNFYRPAGSWQLVADGDGGVVLIDRNATDTNNVRIYHTYYNQSNSFMGYYWTANRTDLLNNIWYGTVGIHMDDSVLFYPPMALGPGNPNTVYYGSDRLYRSTDGGLTNDVVSQQPLNNHLCVSAIGVSPLNDNIRLVGMEDGSVWATTTGSSTLTDITGSLPGYYISRIAIDPTNADIAYVTLSGFGFHTSPLPHVWKTTNLLSGAVWTAVSTGLPDVPTNGIAIDPLYPDTLYIGNDIGVYCSTNGGTSWFPFGGGLPRVSVFEVAIQPTSRKLRIATHGRGMWEIPLFTGSAPAAVEASYDIRWNLVSNPLSVPTDRTVLFSSSISHAYRFTDHYDSVATLVAGTGYWLKFPAAETHEFSGALLNLASIPVVSGWNLIGSIAEPLSTASITANPPEMVTSQFFGYEGRYVPTDMLQPGKGYWVRASESGMLTLSGYASSSPTPGEAGNRIRVVPTTEQPPSPPTDEENAKTGDIPKQYALRQNYPNPFNPGTMIHIDLPEQSIVTLKVYNILGQEVGTLLNHTLLDAGSRDLQFSAEFLPSGLYICRLNAVAVGNVKSVFSDSRKMMLMR